jgi:SlyX protein
MEEQRSIMSGADANAGAIEQRLTELEVRLSFLDSTVQSLDATVVAQDRILTDLQRELRRLRDELSGGTVTLSQDPRDEPPPPHY